jgi:signal transduction histidine kinase
MRANSLALRLFLTATATTVIILVVTSIILSSLYRGAIERAFDLRLGVYLRVLIADIAQPEDATSDTSLGTNLGTSLGEPLFELPLSGWYWQVTRLDKTEVRSSHSLWDGGLPHLQERGVSADTTGAREGYVEGPEDQRLRVVERVIDVGEQGRYLVAVGGDFTEIAEEQWAFDKALMVTFSILAAVLLLTTMFQVRFGLSPLKRISESLHSIRSGRAEKLEGSFPDEIAPLARETNALIEANKEIVDRARTHVGNLAHALKTPLSVVVNEANARKDDPLASKMLEQADIMRDQVTRHLERARLAARSTLIGSITDVAPVAQALARTMEKIHHGRAIAIEVHVEEGVLFRGERPDLEEMLGNLVDNACKWAASRVTLRVTSSQLDPTAPTLQFVVDDDGPGLSATERKAAGKRGQRLDETKPGSGLGLSIVTELADLYGGALKLGAAPAGGLRAELILPAATT